MKINIERDFERLAKRLSDTQRKALPQALNRTIKRVGKATERVVYKAVAKDSGVKQKDLKRKRWFTAHFGTVASPFYKLMVRFGAVSLKDFNPKQLKRGVKASAWGKRKLYRHTFISEELGGHVFARKVEELGPKTRKIKKIWGPTIRTSTVRPETMRQADEIIERRFFPELAQNLRFFMRKR
tara:strand:- start:128 stop:676 length:549 start_codon:yes stop_codon:yes gene_type:complete